MRRALESAVSAHEPLAAPDRAVLAIAGAVERDADHAALIRRPAVLRQRSRDVRLVMLDAVQRQVVLGGEGLGQARRGVIGMQIAGHDLRLQPEEMLVGRQRRPVVLQRLDVLHIADVLADEGVFVAGEGEGVLELRPRREDALGLERQPDGEWRVAPRPPQNLQAAVSLIR